MKRFFLIAVALVAMVVGGAATASADPWGHHHYHGYGRTSFYGGYGGYGGGYNNYYRAYRPPVGYPGCGPVYRNNFYGGYGGYGGYGHGFGRGPSVQFRFGY